MQPASPDLPGSAFPLGESAEGQDRIKRRAHLDEGRAERETISRRDRPRDARLDRHISFDFHDDRVTRPYIASAVEHGSIRRYISH